MARRIGRQTVVIVAQTTDRNGDQVDGTRTSVSGCLIQPQSSTEGAPPNRAATVARFIIYGPPGLAVAQSDHVVEAPGDIVGLDKATVVRLAVDGQPAVWTGLDGRASHVELSVTRVTG